MAVCLLGGGAAWPLAARALTVGVCVLLIIMDGPGEKRLASVKRYEGDPPGGAPKRPSAEPGRNKGMSQTSAKRAKLASYRGRFTQFGKRTSVGGARSAMLSHIFGLAAAEL